jgi:hypothetical protein
MQGPSLFENIAPPRAIGSWGRSRAGEIRPAPVTAAQLRHAGDGLTEASTDRIRPPPADDRPIRTDGTGVEVADRVTPAGISMPTGFEIFLALLAVTTA